MPEPEQPYVQIGNSSKPVAVKTGDNVIYEFAMLVISSITLVVTILKKNN